MSSGAVKFILGVLATVLFFTGSAALFVLAYVFAFLGVSIQTLLAGSSGKDKILLIAVYSAIMAFQLAYSSTIAFSGGGAAIAPAMERFVGAFLVLMPFAIQLLTAKSKKERFSLPSVQDIGTFTFSELAENISTITEIVDRGRKTFSIENIGGLVKDMPRHNSFRYINKGSITDEYFDVASQTLDDLNIYIIISNTGSPASEIFSAFTQKPYNHASLSFDRGLKTIISYNGGEGLYPPGLNMEMVNYFNKKEDSSIIVYSMPIAREKKKMIIDKVKEINKQGNAYNLTGVVFKSSFKPNIMFCSQFIYKMLKMVDLNYFEKKDGRVKPTDLIELDYYRKLKYEYEIKFNE